MAKPRSQAVPPDKFTLLDGKLHVFRRPNSQFWWCGFHHNGTYLRASTKTAHVDTARTAAQQWYFLKQVEIQTGAAPVPTSKTFAAAAAKCVASYESKVQRGERSANYLNGIKKVLNSTVLPALGKMDVSAIDQGAWYRYRENLLKRKAYAASTLHQHKMAIRVVLVEAYKRGELAAIPQFKDDAAAVKDASPRTWFEPREYAKICLHARHNITKLAGTRWQDDARELYDYIVFVANTGLRVGEAMNLRFCDVSIHDDLNAQWRGGVRRYLLIRNIKGKRSITGECKSYFGAPKAFDRIIQRRSLAGKWQASTEPVFKAYHRDMFRELLDRTGLRFTMEHKPRKRDLMSLRHTYICFRLLRGASVYDVASNCRTSVEMIERHYARWLAPRLLKVNG